jgi:hypothetical protein
MYREIDVRTTDGGNIAVSWWWDQDTDTHRIVADDKRLLRGVRHVGVPASEAKWAFMHPFAYELPRELTSVR